MGVGDYKQATNGVEGVIFAGGRMHVESESVSSIENLRGTDYHEIRQN